MSTRPKGGVQRRSDKNTPEDAGIVHGSALINESDSDVGSV